jgi:membrane-associated phospholipid phosphatase
MAAAIVLACVLRRRYGEAAFVAISVPMAAALTELVLKPLIGRTSWGDPFPSGHVTSVAALATALTVLLARTPTGVPRPLRLALAFTAFLIAAAVALGVIGANMHHFSDTVGGAAVGAGTVLLMALVLDILSRKWRLRHDRPLLTAMAQDRDTLQPSRSWPR